MNTRDLVEFRNNICNNGTRYTFKLLRLYARLSVDEMAELIGVSKQTIWSYERNPEKMSDSMVMCYLYIFDRLYGINWAFDYVKMQMPNILGLYNRGYKDIFKTLECFAASYVQDDECMVATKKIIDSYFRGKPYPPPHPKNANETDTIMEP